MCGVWKLEILFWFWEMMKSDCVLLFTHVPFATNEFSNFPCHCVLTKMVSACIKLAGILWNFSSVVIEGSSHSRCIFVPFLATVHDENVSVRN